MIRFHFLLAFLLPLASHASTRPPIFQFDYAKPPASRWDGALALATQGRTWEDTWGAVFSFHNASLFDFVTPAMYQQMGDALKQYYPDQAVELQGIANQFAELFPEQTVSYEYLAAWVYYHELAHTSLADDTTSDEQSCTGLLAADAEGFVHHTANMDQSPPDIRKVTLHVHFTNNDANNILFQGVDWYWFTTGTSRMVCKGKATFQENWRTDETLDTDYVMQEIQDGTAPQIFVFRSALEDAVQDPTIDFEALVTQMATVRLASPYFVIMSGPEKMQGVVIARNLTGVAAPGGVLRIGQDDGNPTTAETLKESPNFTKWALVETNYDHWVEDNPNDPRRITAERTLANAGQKEAASMLGLYAVASTYPVHNPTTAYTAVMDSRTGEMHSFVRTSVCPIGAEDCPSKSKGGFGVQSAAEDASSQTYVTAVPGWAYTIMIVLAICLIIAIGLIINNKSKNKYQRLP